MKYRSLFLALLLYSCTAPQSEQTRTYLSFRRLPADSAYFPYGNGMFSPDKKWDSIDVSWFSRQLIEFKEPKLFNPIATKETYRFTWIPPFQRPITVRLEIDSGIAFIYTKQLDGVTGFAHAKMIVNEKKQLPPEVWKPFFEARHANPFWELPDPSWGKVALDGTQWVLEATYKNTFHAAMQSLPSEDNPFRLICEELMSMSESNLSKKDLH